MRKILALWLLVLVAVISHHTDAAGWRSRVWPKTPEGVKKPIFDAPLPDPDDDYEPQRLTGWVIVIDPGHGGSNPGAVNTNLGLNEKDVNLSVGLKLRNSLHGLGATVKMTRSTDIDLSIASRRAFSNSVNAHRFISLHVNAAANTSYNGIETWVDTDSNQIWKEYAYTLHRNTIYAAKSYDSTIRDLGMKYSGLTSPWNDGRKIGVIRYDSINAPAALLELNFISNDKEANRLMRTDYQQVLADGIATGFVEHSKQYDKEDGIVRR